MRYISLSNWVQKQDLSSTSIIYINTILKLAIPLSKGLSEHSHAFVEMGCPYIIYPNLIYRLASLNLFEK